MFQIEKRGNTISLNEKERNAVNPLISRIQQDSEIQINNIKELFFHLLQLATSEKEVKTEEIEEKPILKEIEGVDEIEDTTEENDEIEEEYDELDSSFEEAIKELITVTDGFEMEKGSAISERIRLLIKKSSGIELKENEMILTFSDAKNAPVKAKIKMLEAIQYNRSVKYGKQETISEIINSIIFQPSTIHNHSRTFYTGF